jgi:hypothetical protein
VTQQLGSCYSSNVAVIPTGRGGGGGEEIFDDLQRLS